MSFNSNSKGFLDTKDFRINILEKANERLGLIKRSLSDGENGTFVPKDRGLLGLLDSTYTSDVPSTNYAIHLKSIAFESARFICTEDINADNLFFKKTRGEYLSQNIASFLFPKQRFAQSDSSNRQMDLSVFDSRRLYRRLPSPGKARLRWRFRHLHGNRHDQFQYGSFLYQVAR